MVNHFESWERLCNEEKFLEWTVTTINKNSSVKGKGFNKFDSGYGETLAYKIKRKIKLNEKERGSLKKMMQKYFKQILLEVALGRAHWASLEEKPEEPEPTHEEQSNLF